MRCAVRRVKLKAACNVIGGSEKKNKELIFMISEQLLPRSLSWICCSETPLALQQAEKRCSWEYTLVAQPRAHRPINVEQLSVQQLENRVRELTQRLQQADQQLAESNVERELCHKRLEVVSQSHECRITEMHCVIAELSKKLRSKQQHIIMEELEPELEVEGSELSYQEGSVYNSELNLTNADAEADCQTENFQQFEGACSSSEQVQLKPAVNISKGQLEALQEEVLHLRAQIALLQAELATKEKDKDQDSALQEEQTKVIYFTGSDMGNNSVSSPVKQQLNDLNTCVTASSPQQCVKVAELVKLRCASKHNVKSPQQDYLEFNNEHIDLVEHLDSLMAPVQQEMSRLQRKVEQLQLQNKLLTLTLTESKQHAEQLYLLCGKYESNAVALQLAVNCSDRAIEAYDVMLALLESRLVLLSDKSATATESRCAVETVAHHLLARLESEQDVCEQSFGPWQHNIKLNAANAQWSAADEQRLRYHVSKLKARRATVQQTIVNLESPFSDAYEQKRLALEQRQELEVQKQSPMELDTAVIMQELLELREHHEQIKSQKEQAEREQQQALERVNILHEALQQLQAANRVSYSEAEHVALTEQQLVEALSRETELKYRIQTLLSLNATQKATDSQNHQLQQNLRELQKSNNNLTQLLEQSKRKYQLRIKKLEQQLSQQQPQQQQHVPETTL
ncbi:colorectal mutant cancer protein isoform X2 [Drosophila busckii]|uniref:colorectal mutant cancer protein isoform X2 n=1 Tax=Drosophila busckii TaxID=30019 RepID=UPI00083F2882|nr:colorectal mutant cancer protein isoform X2 [Drosophila busckii]